MIDGCSAVCPPLGRWPGLKSSPINKQASGRSGAPALHPHCCQPVLCVFSERWQLNERLMILHMYNVSCMSHTDERWGGAAPISTVFHIFIFFFFFPILSRVALCWRACVAASHNNTMFPTQMFCSRFVNDGAAVRFISRGFGARLAPDWLHGTMWGPRNNHILHVVEDSCKSLLVSERNESGDGAMCKHNSNNIKDLSIF